MNESALIGITGEEWLHPERADAIEQMLRDGGWLSHEERIESVTRAGQGNMNLTLRVQSSLGTRIVKQARPWVERYPQIAAPVERADFERRFYEFVQRDRVLSEKMPRLLGAIPERYVLLLEDLGSAAECSCLYPGATRSQGDAESNAALLVAAEAERLVEELVPWLARLHRLPLNTTEPSQFRNEGLCKLNHQHIFLIPFADPPRLDLDAITPGLAAEAKRLREDHGLVRQSQRLGDIYLEPGPCLLHGDFYPGSWLLSASGVKVIDPEFCKCGIPEFDLGVMAAHLTLIDSTRDWLSEIAKRYGELAGGGATEQESAPQRVPAPRAVDWLLAQKFCGVEIIRRLLGVAQLPLQASLAQKRHLLQIAQAAMLGPGVR